MDKTICSNHLTVPSDDDVPFADERHRYLRHCEEVGVTARSLKGKRNELLWIATRLSPDAPKGVDIEALQRLLPQLAAYLGHVNIRSTQRYLQMTPDLLQAASRRFATYATEADHEG